MTHITELNEGDIVVATEDIHDLDRLMPRGTVGIVTCCAQHWMSVDFGDPAQEHTNHVNPHYDDYPYAFVRMERASCLPIKVRWDREWRKLSRRYKNRRYCKKEDVYA